MYGGLRQRFIVCSRAENPFVSMPSRAVDDAWHAFILLTRSYQQFCRKSFGRFLHHTPAEAMADRTTATHGIKRSWRIACHFEKIDLKVPTRHSMLLAMDAILLIARGFHYEIACQPGSNTYCAGD